MVLWMVSIAVSVCLLVFSAAVGASVPAMASAHLFVTGLVSTVLALLAVSETRKLIEAGESQMAIAASLTRFMGLIWAWAALAISITYGTHILEWAAWPQYFMAFMLISGLCLFLSRVLREGAAAEDPDEHMLQISKYIACTTLVFMVTSIGVFGVNRLTGLSAPGAWAADNIIFFGALALAAVSAYQLKASVNEAR